MTDAIDTITSRLAEMRAEIAVLRTKHVRELHEIVESMRNTERDDLWDLEYEIRRVGYDYGMESNIQFSRGNVEFWQSSSLGC